MSAELRTPGVVALERLVEVEDPEELIARIGRLAHEQLELDEGEHDVADVGGAANAPVLQHDPRQNPKTLQSQVATGERQLTARDVTSLRQPLLAILQRAEHEEIRALVEPLLAQADAVHDTIAESQLRH